MGVACVPMGKCGPASAIRRVKVCSDLASIWVEVDGLRRKSPVELAPGLARDLGKLLIEAADYADRHSV